jgi:excisionase family DNA binding protein
MQAYATAELVPLKPGSDREASRSRTSRDHATTVAAAKTQHQSAASAFGALLVDGLDDDTLAAFADRLAPHLPRLARLEPASPHIAFTVASLAEELGVSSKAIRCAIARGELRARKRGSRWIISADAVDEWADARRSRRAAGRRDRSRAPKTAGPSLRSVLAGAALGGAR